MQMFDPFLEGSVVVFNSMSCKISETCMQCRIFSWEWSDQDRSSRQRNDEEHVVTIEDDRLLPAVRSSYTKLRNKEPLDRKKFV